MAAGGGVVLHIHLYNPPLAARGLVAADALRAALRGEGAGLARRRGAAPGGLSASSILPGSAHTRSRLETVAASCVSTLLRRRLSRLNGSSTSTTNTATAAKIIV